MPVMKFLKSVKIIKGRRAALRLHKREIRIQRPVHRADSERIVDQATITIYTIPITQLYGQIILYYGRLCSPKLDAEHSSLEKLCGLHFLILSTLVGYVTIFVIILALRQCKSKLTNRLYGTCRVFLEITVTVIWM